jgi:hypothetical protein
VGAVTTTVICENVSGNLEIVLLLLDGDDDTWAG